MQLKKQFSLDRNLSRTSSILRFFGFRFYIWLCIIEIPVTYYTSVVISSTCAPTLVLPTAVVFSLATIAWIHTFSAPSNWSSLFDGRYKLTISVTISPSLPVSLIVIARCYNFFFFQNKRINLIIFSILFHNQLQIKRFSGPKC